MQSLSTTERITDIPAANPRLQPGQRPLHLHGNMNSSIVKLSPLTGKDFARSFYAIITKYDKVCALNNIADEGKPDVIKSYLNDTDQPLPWSQ